MGIASLAVMPILAHAVPVFAASQIERGNIYLVKNETQNSAFADIVNASCNDTLRFRVHLHNIGPDPAVNVRVKATLPSGNVNSFTSTVTATADNTEPPTVSDTASVNLSATGSVAYVAGSTNMIDINGNPKATLPDGITQSGVQLPSNIGVSVDNSRFVQFKVKVSCPQPPAPKVKFACVALDVTKIDRTRFDFTARASVENATVQSYVFTTKNSGGGTVDTTTVTTNALSAVYHFNQSTTGTYTVNAVVNTDKGSTGVTNVCTKQVTVEAPPVVQGGVTPPPAQQPLPKTGAAGVAGLFAGASALGTIGHYLFRRYR
ncbi:hypothetical protein A3E49_02385 [Candidatus Saccharibacteria bacterium RIFCSPHIGHO2_12_FULL_49_19]|nr:MAG: hypothetical protein A3E49_02385 [Candidatus Saccharibacteria bacterium RIFCSPHIGHO2_12_FULL_49_19]